MKDRGVTQAELAKIAGKNRSVINNWVQGTNPAEGVVGLKKICNAYGYSLSHALTGEPDIFERTPEMNVESKMKAMFDEEDLYDGYARIKVYKLVAKKR